MGTPNTRVHSFNSRLMPDVIKQKSESKNSIHPVWVPFYADESKTADSNMKRQIFIASTDTLNPFDEDLSSRISIVVIDTPNRGVSSDWSSKAQDVFLAHVKSYGFQNVTLLKTFMTPRVSDGVTVCSELTDSVLKGSNVPVLWMRFLPFIESVIPPVMSVEWEKVSYFFPDIVDLLEVRETEFDQLVLNLREHNLLDSGLELKFKNIVV